MTTLWGDLETFCETPIAHGHYKYAEGAELLLYAYAIDDGRVTVWDATAEPDPPAELAEAMEDPAVEVCFHNGGMFDRNVLRCQGFEIPLYRWRDTYVQALTHSLPGALEKLCGILQIPLDKQKLTGSKEFIRLFCKPLPRNMKLRRATRETHPREWAQFIEYADHDVEAMRAIRKRLPAWNYSGAELDLWHLDQRINDRGIALDLDMARAAIATAERVQRSLATRTSDLTAGEVGSTTQRDALLEHILDAHGVTLPDMKGDTITRRLEDPELPWQVRELLANRLEAGRASTAKYKAMLRSASKDGRIRGTLQFAGALRTARWGGRLLQPQNLRRTPKYLAGDSAVDFAAEAIAADSADLFFEKPLDVLAAGVPWAIVAPKGKKLVAPDLSNIEGRVLAWLAGEEWKLKAFREFDADSKNPAKDLYILGYAKSFAEPIAAVVADYEANGKKRQVGKVQELALGYQGSVGAFVSMSTAYGVDLGSLVPALATVPKKFYDKAALAWRDAEAQGRTFDLAREVYMVCHAFTHMWRDVNPAIRQFWWDLEDAARNAIRHPGESFAVGRVAFDRVRNWMRIRLPSGRFLCYPDPKVDSETGKISYMGVNQYSRKWQRIPSYGGKLAENTDQAISRDILAAAMPAAEEAGYEIVFHVHDELVAEVPDTDEWSADELGEILATAPAWAAGLPLSVGGYESYRYRKD